MPQESAPQLNTRHIDYKDTDVLKRFINPHGRILSRRVTGLSAKNQRKVAKAIKQARIMGLLPFIAR